MLRLKPSMGVHVIDIFYKIQGYVISNIYTARNIEEIIIFKDVIQEFYSTTDDSYIVIEILPKDEKIKPYVSESIRIAAKEVNLFGIYKGHYGVFSSMELAQLALKNAHTREKLR